ncbi:PucR family transcriptional regulator [Micromonospora sp. CA-263727]|uniref:PucR family transcriptional regulator n=1 Tax=Micromonospora sp. CA-263727 TaxID=3239967 RepID=UPI003D8E1123
MIETVLDRCISTAFPQHAQDEEFVGRLRASVSQNAYALRDVLVGRTALDDVALDQVLSFATVQAQLRIPQKVMQRSYRISFYTQWELWAMHLRRALVAADVPRDEALEIQAQLTRSLLTYQDHVASRVADTYTRDYEALNRSRAHVRKSLVRDILRGEGRLLSASDLAILAYPLDAHHVAVLLPQMPEGAASHLADGLRAATRSHQSLPYALTLGSTAVWLCRLEPWPAVAMESISDLLAKVGAIGTISNPGQGVDGFVAGLRQAQDAERVRAAWGSADARTVFRYADVQLEILLLQDQELARTFVEAELGPLAQHTNDAARLRETLEASFRFGSHVAAADYMQLHEHTVRNRLHKAEALLGHPLHERRTELQVALRLFRLFRES